MPGSYTTSIVFAFCSVIAHFAHCLDYDDLQAMGLACPKRDKCRGYRNDLPFLQRSCECDSACSNYKDCCIDVKRKSSATPSNTICLHYGSNIHSGIYAISRCSLDWKGPREVKQHCEGSADFSDPLRAAPVTSPSLGATYKNLYCAECNYVDMNSLKVFNFGISCEGLDETFEGQIVDQLSYDQNKKKWGIFRTDAGRDSDFTECKIHFELPSYLNRSVRFCRANIISTCARDWTRSQVKQSCSEYMSVVFDKTRGYRNPHCAICNHKTLSDLTCTSDLLGRGRPISMSTLLDLNRFDNDKPKCPSNHIYDPYFKRCRRLACAIPGYKIQNGKCVPGG